MRIFFAGTPDIAVPSLERLTHSSHTVCGVLCNEDNLSGRGKAKSVPPVKRAALALGLPVFQPNRLDREFRNVVSSLNPELLVTFAYGKIFGEQFLALFPRGGINLHPSLLPKYRGPSPIPATILAGDPVWGISVQRIALAMDTGDILLQESFPLAESDTAAILCEKASEVGARMIEESIGYIESGTVHAIPQDESLASYCGLLKKEDGRIDWTRSSEHIARMIRAYDPWPGTYTVLQGKTLYILQGKPYKEHADAEQRKVGTVVGIDKKEGILVQTGDGILSVQKLQFETKKVLDWRSFLNGFRELQGNVLGEQG